MVRKITVRKEGYWRKAYTRRDGTKVKRAWVPKTTYKMVDKGAPGRTPKSKQWAVFETYTGWKKTQPATTRQKKLVASCERTTYRRKGYTYKRGRKTVRVSPATIHSDRYLCAARKAQQLANVSTDSTTKRLARQDAKTLFEKAKETR